MPMGAARPPDAGSAAGSARIRRRTTSRAGGDDDEAMWMPGYAGSSSMGVRGDADETEDADECESAGDMSA